MEREILEKYLELGKKAHRIFLDQKDDYSELRKLDLQIVNLEIEEYVDDTPKKADMICPNCHKPYDDESIFCSNCGQNLEEFYKNRFSCPICGSEITKGEKYCSACGALVGDIGE